jgi:serine phosphatase RsbU (regulator of sigma subunit)
MVNGILKADNERKTNELEEVRKLQISMLPQSKNDLPDYDICFDMRTATEVGCDYYDFNHARDGSLDIAIGDATGHGMKSALKVAIVKSLFNSIGTNLIITDFFNRCTEVIKSGFIISSGKNFFSIFKRHLFNYIPE